VVFPNFRARSVGSIMDRDVSNQEKAKGLVVAMELPFCFVRESRYKFW
jgi:hypothetical protein